MARHAATLPFDAAMPLPRVLILPLFFADAAASRHSYAAAAFISLSAAYAAARRR
jgi:hypothetical protein